MVFITKTQCVYCAVRTGHLNTTQVFLTALCIRPALQFPERHLLQFPKLNHASS